MKLQTVQTEELRSIAHDYLLNEGFIVVTDGYGGYRRANNDESSLIYIGNYSKNGQQANNSALLIWVSDENRMIETDSIEVHDEKQLMSVLSTLCFLIH